jgi:integrase
MITRDLFGESLASTVSQRSGINKRPQTRSPKSSALDRFRNVTPDTADLFAPSAPLSAMATPPPETNETPARDSGTADKTACLLQKRAVSKQVQSRSSADSVVCIVPPATFAEALELITASNTLDSERLKALQRAVRWVQTKLAPGRDGSAAAPLPCNPHLLRPILQKIHPAQHKVTVKTWSNIRRELATIQRKAGWLPPRVAPPTLNSQSWINALALFDNEAATSMFRSFASYCEFKSIEPNEITPVFLMEYQDHIATTRPNLTPAGTLKALRYAWNRLCREMPDWGGSAFPKKRSPRQICDEADGIPESFYADLASYIEALRKPALFDRRFPMKTAAATIATRADIFKLSASILVKRGWNPETLISLRSITTADAITAILTDYYHRNCEDGGWSFGAETTAAALKTLAIQWGGLSADELGKVFDICGAVRRKSTPFPRKAQERLRQFDDRSVERRFWDLPRKLWEEDLRKHERAGRLKRAAETAKIALALAISFDKPLRIRNLTRLDLALDFVHDKTGRIIGIKIEGERTTKGAAIIEGALSPQTQRMLKTFHDQYRPRLLKHPTSALFPGQKTEYLHDQSLGHLMELTIRRTIGIQVNPHLIRSLIATIILDENPRNVILVQRALDHKSPATSIRSYALQRGRATAAEYADTMERRIRKLNR